ncbi:hypothetical protein Tco_1493023 [Tanacetum coccineum]
MDWLSKRKFVIVCHEKVVRIPLEGDEILQVHGERTQGVVKTLMNTKDKILATPIETSKVENAPAKMLRDLDQQMEKRADDGVKDAMSKTLAAATAEIIESSRGEDRQKSYADNRLKPLEFEVGDRVMLKVSPWKGDIRFGKKGKLAPRFMWMSVMCIRNWIGEWILVKFPTFTFGGKEMTFMGLAFLR